MFQLRHFYIMMYMKIDLKRISLLNIAQLQLLQNEKCVQKFGSLYNIIKKNINNLVYILKYLIQCL